MKSVWSSEGHLQKIIKSAQLVLKQQCLTDGMQEVIIEEMLYSVWITWQNTALSVDKIGVQMCTVGG